MKIEELMTPELKQMLIKMQEDTYLLGKRDCLDALLQAIKGTPDLNRGTIIALIESILKDDKMRGEG
jgi:hypothetical protein